MGNRPRLIILAGCNGCGKTSLKRALVNHEWANGCEIINPDDFAKDKFGGWEKKESFDLAQKYATELTFTLINNRQSILLETAFSSERKMATLLAAKDAGYFIRVYFIGTDDPTINAARVCRRMMDNSGHEVRIRHIIDRHAGAMKMCVQYAALVDRLYVFDNSGAPPMTELFRVRDGLLVDRKISIKVLDHEWAKDLLVNIAAVTTKLHEAKVVESVSISDEYNVSTVHNVSITESLSASDQSSASVIPANTPSSL